MEWQTLLVKTCLQLSLSLPETIWPIFAPKLIITNVGSGWLLFFQWHNCTLLHNLYVLGYLILRYTTAICSLVHPFVYWIWPAYAYIRVMLILRKAQRLWKFIIMTMQLLIWLKKGVSPFFFSQVFISTILLHFFMAPHYSSGLERQHTWWCASHASTSARFDSEKEKKINRSNKNPNIYSCLSFTLGQSQRHGVNILQNSGKK